MSGFFMVDIDDFDEIWSAGRYIILFPLFAILVRKAWRQDGPKCVFESHYKITLWPNQLILHTRQIARTLDLPESTLRDRLHKLEELEAIRIDEPVPLIRTVTILRAYIYHDHGERVPCSYRAPSVVDLRADRDHPVINPLSEPYNNLFNSDLQRPYTDILRDSRLEDSENQNRLVMRESLRSSDLYDHIPDLAAMLKEKTPSITDEQARVEAESLLFGDDDS